MRVEVIKDGWGEGEEEKIIYQFTGNPFVDAGIWAICCWNGKEKPEEINKNDLSNIANDIIPLYLSDPWNSSYLHGMVFPNGKVCNPSFKRYSHQERVKKAKEYYTNLINDIEPLNTQGSCIGCGRRDVKTRITKSEIPLTGSNKFINFFSYGVSGADYCPACTFAIQFAPLLMYSCGMPLLVHSNSKKVMKYWSTLPLKNISDQISKRHFTGFYSGGYKNPRNAIFHIVNIIQSYEERWEDENPSITFYHFLNYNQGADLRVYYFPTKVFRFLSHIRTHEKYGEWLKVVRKGYRYVKWDEVKSEDDYKNKSNEVYNRLLQGVSILRYFIEYQERSVYGDWDLLRYYLKEVRGMDEKRLMVLKKVGDEIARYIKETDNLKRLNQLEMARNYYTFRNVLRLITKGRIAKGEREPLFTLDEYVECLFPEGNLNWRETQDLLLFRIYETLHDWLIEEKKVDLEEIESEVS